MDLWELQARQQIDPEEARAALRRAEGLDDPRTRQLALEMTAALEGRTVDDAKFPSLVRRVRPVTRPETIERFLQELGRGLAGPVRIVIRGSSALILADLLERGTEDVDVVDEVPVPLREVARRVEGRHDLHIAHFQSHYLPAGWQNRVRSRGNFGKLEVYLVDPLDIFVGKLMSKRDKDYRDLSHLTSAFTREEIVPRLTGLERHLADPRLREMAEHNWQVLFGEPLPV